MSVAEFATLVRGLAATASSSQRASLLEAHLRAADDLSAAWAFWFLLGHRIPRTVPVRLLREWVAERAEVSPELVASCHDHVGDLAETLSLLLPDLPEESSDVALAELVEAGVSGLAGSSREQQQRILASWWQRLDRDGAFLHLKLVTGGFRIGVARGIALRSAAAAIGVEASVLEDRVCGGFTPTAAAWRALREPPNPDEVAAQPRPFQLAGGLGIADPDLEPADAPLFGPDAIDLGSIDEWLIEPKWDGVRAQLLRRRETRLASRGEGYLDRSFPEIVDAARGLPLGCVLDGEALLWSEDRPAPFTALQRRLGVRRHQPGLFDAVHAVFFAFDLLEIDGSDVRNAPLSERRSRLETLLASARPDVIRLSPRLRFDTWEAADAARRSARDRGVEGLMLKRLDRPYEGGRGRGSWWKWKADPRTIDAVVVQAQSGHGRRAGLLSDYTLAVRHQGALVPVAKAYSGLSDAEIVAIDRILKGSVVDRRGPLRVVEPQVVLEIAFDRVQRSARHRSGVAVRFPRILRWRRDKTPEEADCLESLRSMLEPDESGGAVPRS